LGGGGRIIEMNDGFLSPDEGLEGAFNQIFACLDQNLKPHVIRSSVFLDQAAVEGELGV